MKNYSDMYNKAYALNAASIFCYKSSRKNSKCGDIININHLINHVEDRRVSDERILQQIAGTISSVYYQVLQFRKHLELTCYIDSFKNNTYDTTSGEKYHGIEDQRYSFQRVKFSSFEQCINFIFDMYCLIYPYNEISRKTLFNDSSVKYYINKFYRG